MILTVHVVLIGGMLLQGCKDTKDNGAIQPAPDNSAAPSTADTVPPAANAANMSNAATGGAGSNVAQAVPPPAAPGGAVPPGAPPMAAPAPAPAPIPAPVATPAPVTAPTATEGHEYVIVSGDTLGALARKNGVSLKALLEANPGVSPKKLHVGQKVQIPGSTGATASAGGAPGATADISTGDTAVYTVKTGDTLGRIARANHVSYKKLMALNDLKTTTIRVGQKLKLPAPKEEAPAAAPAVVPAAPVAPPTAAPAPSTASNQ